MSELKLDQRGFTAFETIVILLLFGLLVVAVNFAYINSPYSKPAPKPSSTPSSVCDVHNDELGCGLNSFTVKAPTNTQVICEGSTFDVKWSAPSDMETVTVTVRRADLTSQTYSLGTFPASDKQYSWHVAGIPPGDVYKLWINSRYKGISVNGVSGGLFTIKDCLGSSPSPSPH